MQSAWDTHSLNDGLIYCVQVSSSIIAEFESLRSLKEWMFVFAFVWNVPPNYVLAHILRGDKIYNFTQIQSQSWE